jgi:hypothetical protein
MSDDSPPHRPPQWARYMWYRFLRRGKFLLGHDPLFLPIFLRLTPEGTSRKITEQTQLVIEGFPRSGNTFTVFAIQDAADYRLRIASHVHHPAQVKQALDRGVPTILVVREPVAALSSYLAYGQHGRPATVLKEYSSYHRELIPYVDQLLVCDFDEIVSDLSAIISRINDRFSMAIPAFDQSPANVERVFEEIARQHNLLHRGMDPDNVVPRPTIARHEVSERARSGLLDERVEEQLADALNLYAYFTTKASQQRSVFEKAGANQAQPQDGRSSSRSNTATSGKPRMKRLPTT